jgi:dCMP deaminase
MSDKRILIINIPVIHRGFLDFLRKNKKYISGIYLVEQKIIKEVSDLHEDIAAIDIKTSGKMLNVLGYKNVRVLNKKSLKALRNKKILLINDQFSRGLASKFFDNSYIKWSSVFLRWDSNSVLSEHSLSEKRSLDVIDEKWMKEAYKEAEKSGDWWRQVGAVIVKNNTVILRAYNESLPNDYTPYQVGNIRDYVRAGEKQELSSTIHSEQKLISDAARKGVSLEGSSLYITHFPCPVCTKLIINSGIKKCFFSEGGSNLSGEKLLKLFGIELLAINLKK